MTEASLEILVHEEHSSTKVSLMRDPNDAENPDPAIDSSLTLKETSELQINCPICKEELGKPTEIVPCGHRFYDSCIWTWMRSTLRLAAQVNECPLCRGGVESLKHDFSVDGATFSITPAKDLIDRNRTGNRQPGFGEPGYVSPMTPTRIYLFHESIRLLFPSTRPLPLAIEEVRSLEPDLCVRYKGYLATVRRSEVFTVLQEGPETTPKLTNVLGITLKKMSRFSST